MALDSEVQRGRVKSGRVIVKGVLLVRGINRRLSRHKRYSGTMCLPPAARVQDISKRLQNILKVEDEQAEVMRISRNYVDRKRDGVLQSEH